MNLCRLWVSAILLAAFAAIGPTPLLAQPAVPVQPAAKQAPPKFQIFKMGRNSALKIDLQTGKSWKLERDGEAHRFVWVPIKNLETVMELDSWKQRLEKSREEKKRKREGLGARDFGGFEGRLHGTAP